MGRNPEPSNLCRAFVLVCATALVIAGASHPAVAQTTARRPTTAAGGGTALGGSFMTIGTVGQAIAGSATGGIYEVRLGFWPGGSAGPVDVPVPIAPVWSFRLEPNTPNPVATRTRIAFQIPAAGPVTLAVFDPGGRLVRSLIHRNLDAGPHSVEWDGTAADGRAVASGVYFTVLTTPATRATRLLALMR
jgi:hypothetical protein